MSYYMTMETLSASKARANFYRLLDHASHEPVVVTGKRNNVVLVGENDWKSIQETLYLLSIPGMRESILKGARVPVSTCSKKLKW